MNRHKHSPDRRTVMLGAAAAACAPEAREAPAPFPMRRGVNLGNALEAPVEGEWGYTIDLAHLEIIRDAGFDGIRLPVRWDAHTLAEAPYTIEPAFFERIDRILRHALGNYGLRVQLDCHHYDALISGGPSSRERERFLAIWSQIARRYADSYDRTSRLIYEPLNEPNGARWGAQPLRSLQADAVAAIREHDPRRTIVLGPGNWQNIDALRSWRPPEGENIAVSVHYYEPHAFTHQGAEWLGDDAPVFGRDWGAGDDRAQVLEHIGAAARWARERGYAMQLGEFGVNRAVGVQQRAAWTRTVREACEAEGLGWCVWDFAGAFPVWDAERSEMIPLMRDALFA
jgi:endoglucanase